MQSLEGVNKKLIGVFGGTFDPAHNGHLKVVSYLLDNLPFNEIRVIPCGIPSHRNYICSAANRLKMVELTFKDQNKVVIDDREIAGDGYSYSIDTVHNLRKEFEDNTSLVWIMGEDVFHKIDSWHRWEEFLNEINILIITRPRNTSDNKSFSNKIIKKRGTKDIRDLSEIEKGEIFLFPTPLINISSSQIRDKIKEGTSIGTLVFKDVAKFININNLYGN